jgi:toxin ParE1/3/4
VINDTWTVRLSTTASTDLENIIRWTARRFVPAQARAYAVTLTDALAALTGGPDIIGVKARDDIAAGIRTLRVARNKRKGRHIILLRVGSEAGHQTVDVLRLLHDAMDLARHVPLEESGDIEGQ